MKSLINLQKKSLESIDILKLKEFDDTNIEIAHRMVRTGNGMEMKPERINLNIKIDDTVDMKRRGRPPRVPL